MIITITETNREFKMIETSQLQTLVAVTQAQSFSKAAEDLHVTQSAISQSIKNLEKKIEEINERVKTLQERGKTLKYNMKL